MSEDDTLRHINTVVIRYTTAVAQRDALLEAAEAFLPILDIINDGTRWSFGTHDEAVLYGLRGRTKEADLTIGMLRKLRAAIKQARGES